MKRMNKIGGIVAVTMVTAGAVLVVIALLMGASWQDANVGLVAVGDGHHGFGSWGNMMTNWEPGPARETTLQEDYTGVTSLDFELEAAEVTITEGEKFSITASGSGSRFESKVTDGVWSIECKGAGHRQDRHYTVQITLPRGFEAQKLDLNMGMGSLAADVLRGEKAQLNCGMGELTVGSLYTDRAVIDCGMGELTVDSLHSKGAEITCGMGTATIGGELLGKTVLDGSMGNIQLNLTGKAQDYGYTTEVGMGSISVGDDSMTGLAGSRSFALERKNTLDITCGMGEIVVQFGQ